jgi:antitoxin (DNA-binding transcriptional repressor) of toxin-antitoxin stability system
MTPTETLTVGDLATSLTEVLERVRGGERFVIERDGEVIAEIVPLGEKPSITFRELAAKLSRLPPLDEEFGVDVEAARKLLLPAKAPEWPD